MQLIDDTRGTNAALVPCEVVHDVKYTGSKWYLKHSRRQLRTYIGRLIKELEHYTAGFKYRELSGMMSSMIIRDR